MPYSNVKLFSQANNRIADLVIGRCGYCASMGRLADYLAHMGSYDIYPLSGTPNKIQSYLTLAKPFDLLTWTSVVVSVMATALTLIVIDRLSAPWKPWIPNSESHQSIQKTLKSTIKKSM